MGRDARVFAIASRSLKSASCFFCKVKARSASRTSLEDPARRRFFRSRRPDFESDPSESLSSESESSPSVPPSTSSSTNAIWSSNTYSYCFAAFPPSLAPYDVVTFAIWCFSHRSCSAFGFASSPSGSLYLRTAAWSRSSCPALPFSSYDEGKRYRSSMIVSMSRICAVASSYTRRRYAMSRFSFSLSSTPVNSNFSSSRLSLSSSSFCASRLRRYSSRDTLRKSGRDDCSAEGSLFFKASSSDAANRFVRCSSRRRSRSANASRSSKSAARASSFSRAARVSASSSPKFPPELIGLSSESLASSSRRPRKRLPCFSLTRLLRGSFAAPLPRASLGPARASSSSSSSMAYERFFAASAAASRSSRLYSLGALLPPPPAPGTRSMRLAANARVAGVSGRPCDTSCAVSAEALDAFLPRPTTYDAKFPSANPNSPWS
mmetsp:Transcript_9096/g.38236  ORF Transcript_9096/g.38236 Transcript_9096/m.38236 type:complete len:435 (+) Transcript_9096:262-1566(+)